MLERNSLMLKLLSIPMTRLLRDAGKLTDCEYLAAPLASVREDLQATPPLRHRELLIGYEIWGNGVPATISLNFRICI